MPAKKAVGKRAGAKAATKKKLAVKKAAAKVAAEVPAKAKSAKKKTPEEIVAVYTRLAKHHHDAHCELDHKNAFELVVATVLSAQSTDVAVNKITPGLFAKYPTAKTMAAAAYDDIENAINRIGMFRMKTKSLMGLSKMLVEKHGGQVPDKLADLVQLPGVGRKTANVVLGVAFGKSEGVVVDTHVQRISQRLGWTKHTEPVEIEQDLMKVVPKPEWDRVSHVLIFHGRRICFARKPNCEGCPVNDACPSAFDAENIGRKGPRPPRGPAK
jgi:endonuclease-3